MFTPFLVVSLNRIDNFEAFLKDLEGGKLEPYLKSEPVPTESAGPVTVAVAKNFEDVITNNGKDTLIEFYAPWYVVPPFILCMPFFV